MKYVYIFIYIYIFFFSVFFTEKIRGYLIEVEHIQAFIASLSDSFCKKLKQKVASLNC